MAIIELRVLLFVLILILVAAVGVGVFVGKRLRQTKTKEVRLHDRAGTTEIDVNALVFEYSPFGLLLLKETGVCHYANAYARRLLGLQVCPCQLPKTAWADMLLNDCTLVRRQDLSSGRYRSVSIPPQSTGENPTGMIQSKSARWWIRPVGEMTLVVLIDNTAQRQAEDASRRLVNDLSHELRTPLATILTHLEILGLSDVAPEVQRQSVYLLKAETNRMARLTNQMLELGRLETSLEIERRPVDLLELVEQVLAQVTPHATERGIQLSLEAESPLPPLIGDADRLQQVFLNLLDNAIKYCRLGDIVTVSLSKSEDGIRCVVHDTGPGIQALHLPHLTNRFYRAAPREVAGTGLGLALTKEILRRHDCGLSIESSTEAESTGTSVSFTLPYGLKAVRGEAADSMMAEATKNG